MSLDIDQARRFLNNLDESGVYTFLTVWRRDDSRSDGRLFHGTLDAYLVKNRQKNETDFYEVTVTVNRTDLKGSAAKNITAVRAIYVDLDDVPLQNIYKFGLLPSAVIETSPGRHHVLWFVEEGSVTIDQYKDFAKKLARLFEADEQATNITNGVRVPGFYHNKGEKFLSQLIEEHDVRYTAADFERELATVEPKKVKPKTTQGTALEAACDAIRNAKPGTSHDTIIKQTFNIAKHIRKGRLAYDEAEAELCKAAKERSPDGEREVHAGLKSAYDKLSNINPVTEIEVRGGHEEEIRLKIEELISEKNIPIYSNLERLICFEHKNRWSDAIKAYITVATMKPVTHATFVTHMFKHDIAFVRTVKKETSTIDTPASVTRMLLDRHSWENIRDCHGLINTPTLRPDGSLHCEEGYDPETRYYLKVDPNFKMGKIPETPTKADAEKAINIILDLFEDVSFEKDTRDKNNETERLNKSTLLCAVLTAVTRSAYRHAPLFLIAAHQAGTGKSFLVQLISLLAFGTTTKVVSFASDEAETEKRLAGIIMQGDKSFSADNLKGDLLDYPLLCQFFTEDSPTIRPLGRSDMVECTARIMAFATGNNIAVKGDMVRRSIVTKLDYSSANPENRKFKHTPARTVIEERGKYVAAVLTIIRAYLASGDKAKIRPLASYEDWSRFCREPLTWLGWPDPQESQDSAKEEDEELVSRADFLRFVDHWYAEPFRPGDVASLLQNGPIQQESAEERSWRERVHAFLLTEDDFKKGFTPAQMGYFLKRMNGVPMGGYKLSVERNDSNGKYYQITKVDSEEK
jgi:hypothetical protein